MVTWLALTNQLCDDWSCAILNFITLSHDSHWPISIEITQYEYNIISKSTTVPRYAEIQHWDTHDLAIAKPRAKPKLIYALYTKPLSLFLNNPYIENTYRSQFSYFITIFFNLQLTFLVARSATIVKLVTSRSSYSRR